MAIKGRNIQPRGASRGSETGSLMEIQKNERAENDKRNRGHDKPDYRCETFAQLHWGLHASLTDVEHSARTPVDYGQDCLITNDSCTVTKAQHRGNEST